MLAGGNMLNHSVVVEGTIVAFVFDDGGVGGFELAVVAGD